MGIKEGIHDREMDGCFVYRGLNEKGRIIRSFDIDEEGAFCLIRQRIGAASNLVEVYDRDQNPVRNLTHEKMDSCIALAVAGTRVYVYNSSSGAMIQFRTDGALISFKEIGLPDLNVQKLAADAEGRLYIQSFISGVTTIHAFEPDLASMTVIGGEEFEASVRKAELRDTGRFSRRRIQDFCVMGSGKLLIKTEPQMLCQYHVKTKMATRVTNLFDYASLILLDEKLLYYTSEYGTPISKREANCEEPRPEVIGRIRLDQEKAWSAEVDNLVHLEEVPIPVFKDDHQQHCAMRQDRDFLYFLDIFSSSGKVEDLESILYRVRKDRN